MSRLELHSWELSEVGFPRSRPCDANLCANHVLRTCSQEKLEREGAHRPAQGRKSSRSDLRHRPQEPDPEGALEWTLCFLA